jgi:hypothetical protein
MARAFAFLALATCVVAACSPGTVPTPSGTPAQTAVAPPSEPTSPPMSPSAEPTARAFPTTSEVELAPGRYDSSPPFDFSFTFAIPEPGWNSAHIHGEFFDVMRFDGPEPRIPTRWIAWAHPETIHGDGDRPATELTPHEAAGLMSTVRGVDAGSATSFTFAGLDGVQLDFHTDIEEVPLFGGAEGDFQLDSSQNLRMGIVKIDGEMLLAMCLAPPAEFEIACDQQQPILDSAEFE